MTTSVSLGEKLLVEYCTTGRIGSNPHAPSRVSRDRRRPSPRRGAVRPRQRLNDAARDARALACGIDDGDQRQSRCVPCTPKTHQRRSVPGSRFFLRDTARGLLVGKSADEFAFDGPACGECSTVGNFRRARFDAIGTCWSAWTASRWTSCATPRHPSPSHRAAAARRFRGRRAMRRRR